MGTILTDKPRSRSGYSKTRSRQTPTYNPDAHKYTRVDRYGEPTRAYWQQEYAERRIREEKTTNAKTVRSRKAGKNLSSDGYEYSTYNKAGEYQGTYGDKPTYDYSLQSKKGLTEQKKYWENQGTYKKYMKMHDTVWNKNKKGD
jgi:hypothetical protein|tara:strand:- start:90 stop:521 length:432 start_codon:yes stop_codon:yes gene_type:complete